MRLFISVLCIQILTLTILPAQDVSSRVSVIKTLANTNFPEQKLEALKSIDEILDSGTAGTDETDLIKILSGLSADGITNVKLDNGQIRNDFPGIRLEAVRLLGKSGSPEAMGALVSVLRYDNNLTVISEAALAAAGLESAEWTPLIPHFYLILKQKKQMYHNDQLILDVLESIRIIAMRDDSILSDPKILEGIVFLSESELGFSKKTTSLADELKSWKTEE